MPDEGEEEEEMSSIPVPSNKTEPLPSMPDEDEIVEEEEEYIETII